MVNLGQLAYRDCEGALTSCGASIFPFSQHSGTWATGWKQAHRHSSHALGVRRMRGVLSESATDHTSFQICYGTGLGLCGFCSSPCVQQSPEGSPQITQFKSARILLLFYIINMYVLLLKKSDNF